MVNTSAQQIFLEKFIKNRNDRNHIFSLGVENNTGDDCEVDILSSKKGFNEILEVVGYSEEEILTTRLDGSYTILNAVYNPVTQNQVVFKGGNNSAAPILCYEVNKDTNVCTLIATELLDIPLFDTVPVFFYSAYDDKFYVLGSGAAGVAINGIDNDLSGSFVGANISSALGVVGGYDLDVTTGNLYVSDRQTNEIHIFSLSTMTLIQTVPIVGATQLFGVKYVKSTNSIYITSKDKVHVMNAVTYTVTNVYTGGLGYTASNIALIDNVIVTIGRDISDGSAILTKWNVADNSIISSKKLSAIFPNANTKIAFRLDDKNRIFIQNDPSTTASQYDLNGNLITVYDTANRVPFNFVFQERVFLGDNMNVAYDVTQSYNPINKSFYFSGEYSGNGVVKTFWVTKYSYKCSIVKMDVTTSIGGFESYNSALVEFMSEPIAVNHLMLFYKNGGENVKNLLKYIKQTSTGGMTRRYFQPKSFVSAQFKDDKIIEINFMENPLIIDASHFFRMIIPAGEKIDFLLFYHQANRKDVLKNKLIC